MTAAASPLTSLVVTYGTDEVADVADVYARMVDELAAYFSDSAAVATVAGRVMCEALASLHVELDELTAHEPSRGELVRLAVAARELATFADEHDDPRFCVAVRSLLELHDALVDLICHELQEG